MPSAALVTSQTAILIPIHNFDPLIHTVDHSGRTKKPNRLRSLSYHISMTLLYILVLNIWITI